MLDVQSRGRESNRSEGLAWPEGFRNEPRHKKPITVIFSIAIFSSPNHCKTPTCESVSLSEREPQAELNLSSVESVHRSP
jgi:hypothetical protein